MKQFDRKFGPEFLDAVPLTPGVYRYWNASGQVIYVGKAIRLRRRLQQYRNAQRLKKHQKMRQILKAAVKLTFEECPTHEEACLQELSLIRDLRPEFNVASAFSFLYPYIGIAADSARGTLSLYLTHRCELVTSPEEPSWHGAYRSRYWTREFFSALLDLLEFVSHRSRPKRKSSERIRGVWSASFRNVPEVLISQLELFLKGDPESEFLAELVLWLVENAGARSRSVWVQERLRTCAAFFKQECEKLARAREVSGFAAYPVPQERRDEIFLRTRLRTF